jgi:DtxR family transcriptional regulator, Mn-dependent transcriptional regulator
MFESLLSLILFVVVIALAYWLLRPNRGAYWRWRKARLLTARVLREDALKHLHRCERYGRFASVDSVAGALQIGANAAADLLAELQAQALVDLEADGFRLTPQGREYALHIIRAHRLWERYLADETGISQEQWHDQAEVAEHRISPRAADSLAAELGNPTHDPHGDPIPTAAGEMIHHGGQPLTAMPLGTPLRIAHLEDEPEAVYAQLVAENLHPGMQVRVLERTSKRVRLWANGDEHLLAPIVAANISVVPLSVGAPIIPPDSKRLSELPLGQTAQVVAISQASRGNERRRFLDLGILPGAEITAELVSAGGDPTAYRVRDTLIALRRDQAERIIVRQGRNGKSDDDQTTDQS